MSPQPWYAGPRQCRGQGGAPAQALVINIVIEVNNVCGLTLHHFLQNKIQGYSSLFLYEVLLNYITCIFLLFALLYLVWWLGSPQTWSNRNFLVAELFLGVMICWWSTVLSINTLQFTHYCQYVVGYANKLHVTFV